MKKILIIACLLFGSFLCKAGPTIPSIVTDGLNSYTHSNAVQAVRVWFKNSPLESDEKARATILRVLSDVEMAYGKLEGWEEIRLVEVSPSVQRVYLTIKYEKGPLFARFDCYQRDKQWTVFSLDFNTKLPVILPNL